MSPIEAIRLESLTIFSHEVPKIRSEDDLVEAERWLELNARYAFRVHNRGVWFSSPNDAVKFKLKYG